MQTTQKEKKHERRSVQKPIPELQIHQPRDYVQQQLQ
jgi:hypothetical protein